MPCAFSTRGNQGTEWSRPWPRSTRLAPAEWSSARRRLGRRVSAPEPGAASCVSIWDATWRSGSGCRAQRGSAVTGGFDTVMAALAAGAPPGWSTRNEATREVAVQGPAPRPGSGHCPAHCVPAPPPTRVPGAGPASRVRLAAAVTAPLGAGSARGAKEGAVPRRSTSMPRKRRPAYEGHTRKARHRRFRLALSGVIPARTGGIMSPWRQRESLGSVLARLRSAGIPHAGVSRAREPPPERADGAESDLDRRCRGRRRQKPPPFG